MQYEVKTKIMETLADLRADIDRAGELVSDENLQEAENLLGDIERDSGAIKGILALIKRSQSRSAKAPETPVKNCPL